MNVKDAYVRTDHHTGNSVPLFHNFSLLKSWEIDDNLDGKYDSLHFNIEIPLRDSEAIHSVQLLLIFDYQLQVNEVLFAFLLSTLLHISD